MKDFVKADELVGSRYRLTEKDPDQPRHDGVSVWRGTDTTLHRAVRITVLHPEAENFSEALDAARRCALFDDPHAVRILSVGSDEQYGWIVTEVPLGVPVSYRLIGTPFPVDQAAAIVGETASILASARSRGIRHLQLGPDDVRIDSAGEVYLDGLAVNAALAGIHTDSMLANEIDRLEARGLAVLFSSLLTGDSDSEPAERFEKLQNSEELSESLRFYFEKEGADQGPLSASEVIRVLAPWPKIELETLPYVPGTEPVEHAPEDYDPELGIAPPPHMTTNPTWPSAKARLADTASFPPVNGELPVTAVDLPAVDAADAAGASADGATQGESSADAPSEATAAPAEGDGAAASVDGNGPAAGADGDSAGQASEGADPQGTASESTASKAGESADADTAAAGSDADSDTAGSASAKQDADAASPEDSASSSGADSAGTSPASKDSAQKKAKDGAAKAAAAGAAVAGASGAAVAAGASASGTPAQSLPAAGAKDAKGAKEAPRRVSITKRAGESARQMSASATGSMSKIASNSAQAARSSFEKQVDKVSVAPADGSPRRFNTSWLFTAISLALVVVAGLWAFTLFFTPPKVEVINQGPTGPMNRDISNLEKSEEEPTETLIASATLLDPQAPNVPTSDAAKQDNPDTIPNLIDDNTSTVWSSWWYPTSTYTYGKDGIGIAIKLKQPMALEDVHLQVNGNGGHVQWRNTTEADPAGGDVIAEGQMSTATYLVAPSPIQTDTIILWFPELPKDAAEKNRLTIAEINFNKPVPEALRTQAAAEPAS